MQTDIISERVVEAPGRAVLRDVRAPDVALAIWRRAPDAALAGWLDGLAPEQLPSCRAVCAADEAAKLAEAACDEIQIPATSERATLLADIGSLAQTYAAILGITHLHMRLDVVRDDACRKFHQDRVTARLLCTYRGDGTEYGHAARGEVPAEIGRLSAQEVGLFRGALWPCAAQSAGPGGIVHRSPPGTQWARPRLLLVLDDAAED